MNETGSNKPVRKWNQFNKKLVDLNKFKLGLVEPVSKNRFMNETGSIKPVHVWNRSTSPNLNDLFLFKREIEEGKVD